MSDRGISIQFRGSLKLDVVVSFFGAGLLRTISSPDYPQHEGTKYYIKVQEPDSYELQGKSLDKQGYSHSFQLFFKQNYSQSPTISSEVGAQSKNA